MSDSSSSGSSRSSSSGTTYSGTSSTTVRSAYPDRRQSRARTPEISLPPIRVPEISPDDIVVDRPGTSYMPADYPIVTPPLERDDYFLRPFRPPCIRCQEYNRREIRKMESTLFQMWFICLLTLAALMIPVSLMLLPYINYSTPTITPSQRLTLTTPYPWVGVPKKCLKQVKLVDNIKNLKLPTSNNSHPAPRVANVYCLFNNSRFRKRLMWDYLPQHIPLGLCPNVIYWSMSIAGGRVTSRVPEFDTHYGVYHLRNISKSWGAPGRTIFLLALGGYDEDSVHFSRLGKDRPLMDKFADNILRTIHKHDLDGVTIHWKNLGGECGFSKDLDTMVTLIRRLKKLYTLNALPYLVTVIATPVQGLIEYYTQSLLPVSDRLFFETHTQETLLSNFCLHNAKESLEFLNSTKRMSYAADQGKICFTASAAALYMDSVINTSIQFVPTPPMQKISQVRGKAAIYEVCQDTARMTYQDFYDCHVFRTHNTTPDSDLLRRAAPLPAGPLQFIRMYGFIKEDRIRSFFSLLANTCVLVYDIDLDAYRSGCSSPVNPTHVRNFGIRFIYHILP